MTAASIEKSYALAKEQYAAIGVDVDAALQRLQKVAISIQCWQGDDVNGFESTAGLSGGIMATGNYPGRARTADELRADATKAMSLMPGKHRFSIHAIYLEHGGKKVERTDVTPAHFQAWMDWAADQGIALDFNSDVLLASEGRRRLHARPPGRRHSKVLGRSRHRLPQDQRGDGPPPRFGLHPQHLDPRRHEGRDHRPQCAASAAEEVVGRNACPGDRSEADARLGRGQAVWARLRDVRRRIARILHGLCRGEEDAADVGRRPLPPNRDDFRQDFLDVGLSRRSPAPRQPRHPLGQRPRRVC